MKSDTLTQFPYAKASGNMPSPLKGEGSIIKGEDSCDGGGRGILKQVQDDRIKKRGPKPPPL